MNSQSCQFLKDNVCYLEGQKSDNFIDNVCNRLDVECMKHKDFRCVDILKPTENITLTTEGKKYLIVRLE